MYDYRKVYMIKNAAWYDNADNIKRVAGTGIGALLGGTLGSLNGKGTALAGAVGGGALGLGAGDLMADESYLKKLIGKDKEKDSQKSETSEAVPVPPVTSSEPPKEESKESEKEDTKSEGDKDKEPPKKKDTPFYRRKGNYVGIGSLVGIQYGKKSISNTQKARVLEILEENFPTLKKDNYKFRPLKGVEGIDIPDVDYYSILKNDKKLSTVDKMDDYLKVLFKKARPRLGTKLWAYGPRIGMGATGGLALSALVDRLASTRGSKD
jgi:hypothetical protein